MSKQRTHQPRNGRSPSDSGVFSEFSDPAIENFHFLMDEHGWRGPFLKSAGRECAISFKGSNMEIELAYEPLTLPWVYVKRLGKGTVSLNEILKNSGFHLNESKYRE